MFCSTNAATTKNNIISKVSQLATANQSFEKVGEDQLIRLKQDGTLDNINHLFGEKVIKPSGNLYTISPSQDLINRFIGEEQKNYLLSNNPSVKLIRQNRNEAFPAASLNNNELFTFLNFPEISELTQEKLHGFLRKLNPDFRVEMVDNLSEDGQAYIKDFLIRLNSFSGFKAMPEEVAHFFVELLPNHSQLRKDLLDNIINYDIYSHTYRQYSAHPEYQKDGKTDVDKIKREAAAKLIAEYIYALSEKDTSRLDKIGKKREGFLKKWVGKFLQWIGMGIVDSSHFYKDVAGQILSADVDTSLKERKPEDELTSGAFYQLTQKELYRNAADIIALNPPRLLSIMETFRREFNDKFISILRDEKFKDINDMLKLDPTDKNSLNKLNELSNLLKGTSLDPEESLDSYAGVQGVKQFLEVIDRMSLLSDAITSIVSRKEDAQDFAQAINNIQELESYMSLYETFKNIISNDLTNELIKSHKQLKGENKDAINIQELIDTIKTTQGKFSRVNDFIINNLEGNFFVFYKELLKDTNDNVSKNLLDALQREESRPTPNKDIIKKIKKDINKHVQSDEKILKMLTGKTGGEEDIDPLSNFNHLLSASIANGNMYVAGIVKYIQSHLYQADSKTLSEQNDLLEKADKIEKKLGEDAYALGNSLATVEKQYDPNEEGKARDVLVLLDKFKGADLDKKLLKEELTNLRKNLPKDKNSEAYKQASEQMAKKVKEYNNFLEKYYNRPFVSEYYNFMKDFHNDPLFIESYDEWESISKEIRELEGFMNNGIFVEEDYKELAEKRRQRGYLLQEVDEMGQPKSEDDLKKVKILKDFFEKGSKFRETDQLQSDRAFQADRIKYEQKVNSALNEIESKGLSDIKQIETELKTLLHDKRIRIARDYEAEINSDPMHQGDLDLDILRNLLMEKWVTNNTLVIPSENYRRIEKETMDRLEELKKKGELTPWDIALNNLYTERRNLLFGYRDNNNQVNPDLMPAETVERLNEIEQDIERVKSEKPKDMDTSEFSEADRKNYEKYMAILADKSLPYIERYHAKVKSKAIASKYTNSEKQKEVRELWKILAELSTKNPTEYYWDKMDTMMNVFSEYIRDMSSGQEADVRQTLQDFYKDVEERVENRDADYLDFEFFPSQDFEEFLGWVKDSKHKDLHEWFVNSHVEKRIYDPQQETYVQVPFARNSIYVHKLPTILDEESEKAIGALHEVTYNKKYRRTRIKDEYRTGYDSSTGEVNLKVGEHVDNRGEWLPLSVEQGQTDRKYINEDYYKLKNSKDAKDKLRMQYLDLLKETLLAHQELLPKKLRTWMNVPVRELDKYEEKIHAFKHAPDTLKRGFDKVKSIFTKSEAGDAEAQMSGDDTTEDIDQFTKQVIPNKDRIQKIGMMEKLPIQRISRNLLGATAEYISKANNFEGRSEAQPVVKALIELFKNNQLHGANNKQLTSIFEKLYSQMILQEVPDSLTNNRTVKRFVKLISSSTGLRLLADIPGGLINYGSAQVNNIIEAVSSQHLSPRDYLKGNMLAAKMIKDLVADYRKKSDLSYSTLLYQNFDFIQGEFEEDVLHRTSAKAKMSSIRDFAMIPRKSGELHAQSAIALGILQRNKALNSKDGKSYPMHEIYRAEGNKLVLKEGFDHDMYNPINGTEYLAVKKLINRVNMELHGNYAKINQTEASRHSIGKLAENMKRWFSTGLSRRWGRELPDITYEDLNEGYYHTFFKALWNVMLKPAMQFNFSSSKDWFNYYTSSPMYKANLKRAVTDFSVWGLLYFTYAFVFGYSGPDKDKKLDENGALLNLAILTSLRMYSEANAYMPIPSMGLGELKRNAFSPLSLPMDTFSNASAVGQLGLYQVMYAFGDDSLQGDLYYQKDGGYWFTEKGDSKFMKYIFKNFGYTGYTQNPGQYIKDFEKLQGKLK